MTDKGVNAESGFWGKTYDPRHEDFKIRGVFSTHQKSSLGKERAKINVVYHYAEEEEDGVRMRPLSEQLVPVGAGTLISKKELMDKYSPEVEFYLEKVLPRIRHLEATLGRGERFLAEGETLPAEMEFNKALELDEDNIRAVFGLGLCYLKRDDKKLATEILGRLVEMPSAFDPEHKHLFNQFGIMLRKKGMHRQSVRYYTRALDFASDDENLFYNLARAEYESGDANAAVGHLKRSLELNPDMAPGRRLLKYINKTVPALA